MYVEHFDMASVTPQKWGEMGWILETNKNMNSAMDSPTRRPSARAMFFVRPRSRIRKTMAEPRLATIARNASAIIQFTVFERAAGPGSGRSSDCSVGSEGPTQCA